MRLTQDYLSASDFILWDPVRNWLSENNLLIVLFIAKEQIHCTRVRSKVALMRWRQSRHCGHELVPSSCDCLHKRPRDWTNSAEISRCCLWSWNGGDSVLSPGSPVLPCPLLLGRWAFLFCVCVASREQTGTKSRGRWQHLLWETGGWRVPSRAPTSCPSAATLWKKSPTLTRKRFS